MRSLTHAACTLNGHHTREEYARGCPVLRAQRRGCETPRRPPEGATNTLIAGPPKTGSENDDNPQGSKEGFAPLATAQKRLGRPGRPATGTSRWARRRRRLAREP